jgi:SHS2 domain-containing protein
MGVTSSSLNKTYEIFAHTADIGLKIKGSDLKGLFKNAGLAVFKISSRKQITKNIKIKQIKIAQKADNLEELFINWLNELLSLSAAKGIIFEDIKVNNIEDKFLDATVRGYDMKNYKVDREIKAATYHGLKIGKKRSGWQAKVILDV